MGMFDKMGDMMDMLGKLKETHGKIEETKKLLSTEIREFSSNDNQVNLKISLTGEIKELNLNFLSSSDDFSTVLKETLNKAYKSTRDEYEQKLEQKAREDMPKMPF
ncbi:MAG: hypothetical protein H6604_09640 [Flavobacteriales bacterium]|nr:hypothetical protein [Flavobacteriales bacterium]